jgi:hypothetical protein
MRKSRTLLGVTLATPALLASEASARGVAMELPAQNSAAIDPTRAQTVLKRVLLELDDAAKLQIAGDRVPALQFAQVSPAPRPTRQHPNTLCQACVCRRQGVPSVGQNTGTCAATVTGQTGTPSVGQNTGTCAATVTGQTGTPVARYSEGCVATVTGQTGTPVARYSEGCVATATGQTGTPVPDYTSACR